MSDGMTNEEAPRDGQGETAPAMTVDGQSGQPGEAATEVDSAARSSGRSDEDAASRQDDRISPATASSEVVSDAPIAPANKRRNRIAACIAAACLAVAIVAGVGYASGMFGNGNANQTVVSGVSGATDQSFANGQGSTAGEGNRPQAEGQAASDSSAQSSESPAASADQTLSQQQNDDQRKPTDSSAPAADESSSSEGQTATGTSPSTTAQSAGPSSDSSSNPSSDTPDSANRSSQEATQQATETISVYISIDSSRAAEYGLSGPQVGKTLDLPEDSTVYDALRALGYSLSGSSAYVSAIGGLAEKQCGNSSGWTYAVNGEFPGKACGRYKLAGGESISWIYSTEKNPTISM
jgi:hypothetical protein